MPTGCLRDIPASFHFNVGRLLLSWNTPETLLSYFLQFPLWCANRAGMCSLPDDLRYVNADWQDSPSSLFLCLSLSCWLTGGPKNLLCSLRSKKKKASTVWQCLNLFAEMGCYACQSLDPPLILAFFSTETAMNSLSAFLWTKKQKGAGMFWSEYHLRYLFCISLF